MCNITGLHFVKEECKERYLQWITNHVIVKKMCPMGDAEKVEKGEEPYEVCDFIFECGDMMETFCQCHCKAYHNTCKGCS